MRLSNNLMEIFDIVTKINRKTESEYYTDKCEYYFNSLENIINFSIDSADSGGRLSPRYRERRNRNIQRERNIDVPIAQKLSEIISHLTSGENQSIIEDKYVKELIDFEPHIMHDQVLARKRYNPSSISNELRREASIKHRSFIESCKRGDRNHTIISNLCSLLYVVRNNLKHGGKTPYGPDLHKAERDERICKATFPILEMIIDILLEYPSHKLICYGTLRKGQANENFLKGVNEDSIEISIFGSIELDNGLPYYKSGLKDEISAELIKNKDLYMDFEKLDKFEGKSYKRILAPYKLDNEIFVGNVYVDNRR